jgi:hypothetical protein
MLFESSGRCRGAALVDVGWIVQNYSTINLHAGPGIAVRELSMTPGHGYAA